MIKCPRCSEVLVRRRAGAVQLDGCLACGGSFFDQGELSILAADPGLLASVDALFRPTREPLAASSANTCPKCATAMTPFEQPAMPAIQLDACRTCKGIWLDGGEATEIATRRGYVAPAPVAVAAPRAALVAAAPVASEGTGRPAMLQGEALTWSVLGAVALAIGLLFVGVDASRWNRWPRTTATFEGHSFTFFSTGYRRSRSMTPLYSFQLDGQTIEGRGGAATIPFWLILGHARGAQVAIAYNPEQPTEVMEHSMLLWDFLTCAGIGGAFLFRARQRSQLGE